MRVMMYIFTMWLAAAIFGLWQESMLAGAFIVMLTNASLFVLDKII